MLDLLGLSLEIFSFPLPYPSKPSSSIQKRVKELATHIFAKIADLLSAFKKQSQVNNLKTITWMSCLSLMTLLMISILKRYYTKVPNLELQVPNGFPMKKNPSDSPPNTLNLPQVQS